MRIEVHWPVGCVVEKPDFFFLRVHGFRQGVERAQKGAHVVEEWDVPS